MGRRNPRNRNFQRTFATREARDRILIVVEGRCTEKNYFCNIRDIEKLNTVRVAVVSSKKTNPLGIVGHAKSLIEDGTENFGPKSFEFVYIVFDHDGRDKEYHDAIKLINNLNLCYKTKAKTHIRFVAIPSNPNFELWFLLHHKSISPHEMNSSDVLGELLKHWPQYKKNAKDTYQITRQKLTVAQSNAKTLRETPNRTGKDAVTYVDILVAKLVKTT